MASDAIINPLVWDGSPKLGSLAVMMAVLPDCKDAADRLKIKKQHHLPLSRVYAPKEGRGDYSIAGPMMGAPYAVYVLEQLIAWGAKKVVFFGWCGSISPEVVAGDIILPTSAFVDEGTSVHYSHTEKGRIIRSFPDSGLSLELEQSLENSGLACVKQPIWTTDALFRETPEKVAEFAGQGAVAVEMELSALQTAACFRNVPLCGLLVVSDELHSGQWKPGFAAPRFQEARKKAIEALCKFCQSP